MLCGPLRAGSCYGNRLARTVSRETEMSQLKRSRRKLVRKREADRGRKKKGTGMCAVTGSNVLLLIFVAILSHDLWSSSKIKLIIFHRPPVFPLNL